MRKGIGAALGLALALAGVRTADAVYETDRYKAQAEITMQSTFQSDGVDDWEYVQQRQEVALGLVYKVIPSDNTSGFFRKIDFSILWRGRYDAIFQIREHYRHLGFNDRPDYMFPEGDRPRELYFDFEFNGMLQPLSLRIGKQQIVWGEADFFRSLDVINPLRLDQMSLVGDDLDDYREPLWIAKALVHVGDLPGLSSVDIEAFYSPDGRPLTNKLILGNGWREFDEFKCIPDPIDCRRPHNLGFERRRPPWEIEAVGPDYNTAPDQGDLGLDAIRGALGLPDTAPGLGGALGKADFIYLGNQKFGDRVNLAGGGWNEIDPKRRSMAGIRFMGQTSTGGVYFTLNYLWKRAEIPSPGIGWASLFQPEAPFVKPDVLLETGANYTQTLLGITNAEGLTANQAALKDCMENSTPKLIVGPVASATPEAPLGRSAYGYAFGTASVGQACVPIPLHYPHTHVIGGTMTYNDYDYTGAIFRMEQSLSTKEPRTIFPALAGTRAGTFPNQRDFDTGGWTKMQLWRSMVGFDYLSTIFQHSQVPRFLYNNAPIIRSLMVDQWFFTFQFFNEYWAHVENQLGQDFSLTNRHQHFNPILTWIMTGFFDKSRLRPTFAYAYDVNGGFQVAWLQAQYYILPQLQLRLGSVLYMGSFRDESFLLLHKYADRDTTYLRLTYFLL